jgi:hypothetical protein
VLMTNGLETVTAEAAAFWASAGILLALTQQGPAVLGSPERPRSRRDSGVPQAIGSRLSGDVLRRIFGLNCLEKGVYGWLVFVR